MNLKPLSTLLSSTELSTTSSQGSSKKSDTISFPDVPTTDTSAIRTFFDCFPYSIHTLQFIGAKNIVRTYTPDEIEKCASECVKHNQRGLDVYFMVNEGDGVTKGSGVTVRNGKAVAYLSQCFIDSDGCAFDKITKYLSSIHIEPHLVVSSSPGRYHIYFNLVPVKPTPENMRKWRAVQEMLARLGDPAANSRDLGLDSTMSDPAKLLRVPGFIHISKRSRVEITHRANHQPYVLDDMFNLCDGESRLDYEKTLDPDEFTVDLSGNTKYTKGERWLALRSAAMTIANRVTSHKEAVKQYAWFVEHCLDNSDPEFFTADKALTNRARAELTSALAKIKRESLSLLSKAPQLPAKSAPTPEVDWSLPDDFYYSAPNGFGDVVKFLTSNSLYPCAAISFASALTALSCLRSLKYLTPTGCSPSLYMLVAAPTGTGKSNVQVIISNTFAKSALHRHIFQRVRSDQGLIGQLQYSNNVGCFFTDEVYSFLKSIQDTSAASYLSRVYSDLLDLYSSGNRVGWSGGRIGSTGKAKAEKEIILDYPALSFCGFLVNQSFESLMTVDAIAGGFLPRIIPVVIPYDTPREANFNADQTATITHPLFTPELPHMEAVCDPSDPAPETPLMNRVPVKMKFDSPETAAYYNSIYNKYDGIMNGITDISLNSIKNCYSRCAENVIRVASTLSINGVVNGEAIEFADKFIESRAKNFAAIASTRVSNSLTPVHIRILKAANDYAEKFNSPHMPLSYLIRKSRVASDQAEKIIKQLILRGDLEDKPIYNSKSQTRKSRPGIVLLREDLDDC